MCTLQEVWWLVITDQSLCGIHIRARIWESLPRHLCQGFRQSRILAVDNAGCKLEVDVSCIAEIAEQMSDNKRRFKTMET
jgi:hypothetical protein